MFGTNALLVLACAPPVGTGPGHAYRLTHGQWENTVVDLLGLSEATGLSDSFVPDATGSTFDTNAEDLVVSPVLWQQYQAAAEELAERAVTEDALYEVVAPARLRPAGASVTDDERDAWLDDFGARAFRRPLQGDERAAFVTLFENGGLIFDDEPFAAGVRGAVTGFLQAPAFLYRTEGVTGSGGELSAEELASRLSYALWNSMPDRELMGVAEADGLPPDTLAEQAERMLDDPKGHAMVANLHRQLLHVDSYETIWRPSDEVKGIDVYDTSTPAYMQAELYAFVDEMIFGGATVRDLLTTDRTWINSDLAEIYDVDGVEGEELVEVALDPSERSGLLTLSGFLAWQADTSDPNLIERGAFVNDAFLCVDLPPPPSTATPLPTADETDAVTLRDRIEEHTSACGGSCHNDLINPIGYAFGRYDEDAEYTTYEGVHKIDATGSYAFEDGTFEFDGAVELSAIMAEREQVHRCYVGHLAAYLQGRSASDVDADQLETLTAASMADRPIRDLMIDIVTDPSFREVNG
jgi:hypothetical protein